MPSRRSAEASAPEHQGDDLRRISGIGPVVARKLEDAGICTFDDLAASTPGKLAEVLVRVRGCSAGQIAAMDWIGQARRFGGVPPETPQWTADDEAGETPSPDAAGPMLDSPPFLQVVRLGRARIRPVHQASRTDQPTSVGLELRPGPGTAPAPTLDYSAEISARRLDGDGEVFIVRMGGVVRVDQGISHAAAGPPLEAGLYRLVATVEAHSTGHGPDDPPVWSEAASGDLLQVVAPAGATEARSGEPAKPHPASKRLLAAGMITEAEYAELQTAESQS